MSRLLLLLVVANVAMADSAQVVQIEWPTKLAAAPVQLSSPAKEWLPAFRLALGTLPEASVVSLSLSQPQWLGLSADEAQVLHALVNERHKLMATDTRFQTAPSALPYCFAESKPDHGLSTLYIPEHCTANTPSIVFLHGYGGSFLWCLHAFAEAFPDHIIMCPAYGLSCASIPGGYVREAVHAAEARVGWCFPKPTLVGLSAGGFGACAVYAERPANWRRVVCMAAYFRGSLTSGLAGSLEMDFIAGAREYFVVDGTFRRGVSSAKALGGHVEEFTVPESGHFFMLEKRAETFTVLRRWILGVDSDMRVPPGGHPRSFSPRS